MGTYAGKIGVYTANVFCAPFDHRRCTIGIASPWIISAVHTATRVQEFSGRRITGSHEAMRPAPPRDNVMDICVYCQKAESAKAISCVTRMDAITSVLTPVMSMDEKQDMVE
jgi:hypothetical protein